MLAALPEEARRQAREAYVLFRDNPNHPGLRFKKVRPKLPVFSARISLNYRAVGTLKDDVIAWFWIGSHADYEALLRHTKRSCVRCELVPTRPEAGYLMGGNPWSAPSILPISRDC